MVSTLLALAVTFPFAAPQEPKGETPQATAQHEILKKFVGDWECEVEGYLAPDGPPMKSKSTMTGKMIGNFWAVVSVKGDAAGIPYFGQGTFGYDSGKLKKYVGTWCDSMSEFMWRYEGTVEGNKLMLNSEGPNPAEPGKMIKARDTWEFKDADTIILTGEFEGPDGKMRPMMKAICKRKK